MAASNNFGELNGLTQHNNWRKYRIDYPFIVNGGTGGGGDVKGGIVDEQTLSHDVGGGGGVGGGDADGVGIIYDDAKQIVKQKSIKLTMQHQQQQPLQQQHHQQHQQLQRKHHTTHINTKHHQATEEEVATIIDADLNWPQRVSDSSLSDVDSNLIDTGHISKDGS